MNRGNAVGRAGWLGVAAFAAALGAACAVTTGDTGDAGAPRDGAPDAGEESLCGDPAAADCVLPGAAVWPFGCRALPAVTGVCGSACDTVPRCGDGYLDPGESCDATTGECVSRCPTAPICGDGVVDPGEQCDDGNGDDYDGCDQRCRREQALRVTAMRILPGDQGCDFVDRRGTLGAGDCRVDNRLGEKTIYRESLNAAFALTIGQGSLLLVLVLEPLADPSGRATQDATLYSVSASRGELGSPLVYLNPYDFLPDGRLSNRWTGRLEGETLTLQTPRFSFSVEDFSFGEIPFDYGPASLTARIFTDDRGIRVIEGTICATVTARTLALLSVDNYVDSLTGLAGLQNAYANILDVLVLGDYEERGAPAPLQPDVDLDGDGLERFEDVAATDARGQINRCWDGASPEPLEGTACALDPRIEDGFSFAAHIRAEWAPLGGLSTW